MYNPKLGVGMSKTLIQAREEARQRYMRTMSMVASLPAMLIGAAMLYFGYSEQNLVYLFLYFFFGLGLLLLGAQLLISGFPSSSARIIRSSKVAEDLIGEAMAREGGVSANYKRDSAERCPNCGADITSAGKFCGSCGRVISRRK